MHSVSNKLSYIFCFQSVGRPRDERRRKSRSVASDSSSESSPEKTVGVNRVIRVVSTGDLTFSIDESTASNATESSTTMVFPVRELAHPANLICMTTSSFVLALLLLLAVLLASCAVSAYLCLRLRPFKKRFDAEVVAFRAFPVQFLGGPPVDVANNTATKANKKHCFNS